jgi:hypothetical protein
MQGYVLICRAYILVGAESALELSRAKRGVILERKGKQACRHAEGEEEVPARAAAVRL